MAPVARYDAVAEWFDNLMSRDGVRLDGPPAPDESMVWDLLGPGHGRCLDLGCGTGARAPRIQHLGWRTVGIDLSRKELRIARATRRLCAVACADAARLPVASMSMDAVVSLSTHTDFDDWASAVGEVQRVLRPGGAFVYAGMHPCFIGPFSELREDGVRVLHEGYRDTRLRFTGPGIGDGVGSRVGVRHLPLADLLNPVLSAGLRISKIAESPERTLPLLLAFRAERPT